MSVATCNISECDRPVSTRGWCGMHYQRWNRNGDPNTRLRFENGPTCSLCDRPARTRGMCQMHYQRLWRHGDPDAVLQLGRPLGDNPSYEAAHLRVKAKRGRAADFPCVDCGGSAHHWSYKNGGGGYSADPDEYEPRCAACHVKFDRPPRPLCSIDGCNTAHHAQGMCRKHYNQSQYRKREGVIK